MCESWYVCYPRAGYIIWDPPPPTHTPHPPTIEAGVADKDSGLVIISKGAGNGLQSSERITCPS